MKSDWRNDLRALVAARDTALFPLLVYKAHPPSSDAWPPALPVSDSISQFYSVCDGGYIGELNWCSLNHIESQTHNWIDGLKGYYQDGRDVLVAGRHVVFAIDSGGAPLIWDSETDLMATFWFKGGDWEPTQHNLDEFLNALFAPSKESGSWGEALVQLRAQPLLYTG